MRRTTTDAPVILMLWSPSKYRGGAGVTWERIRELSYVRREIIRNTHASPKLKGTARSPGSCFTLIKSNAFAETNFACVLGKLKGAFALKGCVGRGFQSSVTRMN